jgi:hypothetical protein
MIIHGNGKISGEANEPALRTCWICNPAHDHLKKVNTLHLCIGCNRYWVFDQFLDELKSNSAFDEFFHQHGLGIGESTTKIDAGYRVVVMVLK